MKVLLDTSAIVSFLINDKYTEKSEQISKSSLEEIGITQAEIEKWCADNPGTCKD